MALSSKADCPFRQEAKTNEERRNEAEAELAALRRENAELTKRLDTLEKEVAIMREQWARSEEVLRETLQRQIAAVENLTNVLRGDGK